MPPPLLETGVGEEAVLDDVLVHLLQQGQVLARPLELLFVHQVKRLKAPVVGLLGVVRPSRAVLFSPHGIVLREEGCVRVGTCLVGGRVRRRHRAHRRVIHCVNELLSLEA